MTPLAGTAGVLELTREEGRDMVRREVETKLHTTLEEFEQAYDAGTLDYSQPDVLRISMLLPFAR
jgi:hypothetical protein